MQFLLFMLFIIGAIKSFRISRSIPGCINLYRLDSRVFSFFQNRLIVSKKAIEMNENVDIDATVAEGGELGNKKHRLNRLERRRKALKEKKRLEKSALTSESVISVLDNSTNLDETSLIEATQDDIEINYNHGTNNIDLKDPAVEPVAIVEEAQSEKKITDSHFTTVTFDSLPISHNTKRALTDVMKYR